MLDEDTSTQRLAAVRNGLREEAILEQLRQFASEVPAPDNAGLYEFLIALGLEHDVIAERFPLIAQARDALIASKEK